MIASQLRMERPHLRILAGLLKQRRPTSPPTGLRFYRHCCKVIEDTELAINISL
ncbi:hypothetical protein J6590_056551 [Homalodisca vitripennis]|nr:hypothetical protein J6590_056551 [Homalodisca vitripennis]